jgi:hypothetical protein
VVRSRCDQAQTGAACAVDRHTLTARTTIRDHRAHGKAGSDHRKHTEDVEQQTERRQLNPGLDSRYPDHAGQHSRQDRHGAQHAGDHPGIDEADDDPVEPLAGEGRNAEAHGGKEQPGELRVGGQCALMENEERQGEDGGQNNGIDDSDDQSLGEWGKLDQPGLEFADSHSRLPDQIKEITFECACEPHAARRNRGRL